MSALDWLVIGCAVWLLVYPPIFKTWFGFRKPKGHRGGWFQ